MEIIRCGQWLGEGDGYSDGEIVFDVWECSECGYTVEDDDPDLLPNYCPNCGAKMKANAPVPPNPPLTLEDLREMDMDPIYIVSGQFKDWRIPDLIDEGAYKGFVRFTDRSAEPMNEYGKTWLAYRRKLEEGT